MSRRPRTRTPRGTGSEYDPPGDSPPLAVSNTSFRLQQSRPPIRTPSIPMPSTTSTSVQQQDVLRLYPVTLLLLTLLSLPWQMIQPHIWLPNLQMLRTHIKLSRHPLLFYNQLPEPLNIMNQKLNMNLKFLRSQKEDPGRHKDHQHQSPLVHLCHHDLSKPACLHPLHPLSTLMDAKSFQASSISFTNSWITPIQTIQNFYNHSCFKAGYFAVEAS